MKKQLILLAAMTVALTGCYKPMTRSMGATLMPLPLMHRSSPDSSAQELSVTASGFYGHTDDAYNVENLNAFGGNIGLTYRMGGKLSPFFLNVAAGVFGGSLHFGCDASYRCLRDSESDEERILTGADFRLGYLIIGAAVGFQLYEGSSDYDSRRAMLDNEGLMECRGGDFGADLISSFWLGTYLGRQGQYGILVVEYTRNYKDVYADVLASIKWTYTHPSGFFGGVARNDLIKYSVFAGKQFVF